MTTLKLDLERDEREDKFRDEIAVLDAKFRASGQIGDLVRLRDARMRCGLEDARAAAPLHSERMHTKPGSEEWADGVVDMDFTDVTKVGIADALQRAGVVLLRNVFPARRALELRKDYERACAASESLLALEKDGLPDLRHADEKEMFVAFDKKMGIPVGKAQNNGALQTFMSPRITLEIIDFLTTCGFHTVLRHVLRDEARFRFETCTIHPANANTQDPNDARGLTLWCPLFDCGAGTQRTGLEVGLNPQAKSRKAKAVTPFIAAGDLVIFQNNRSETISYGKNLTHSNLAVSLQILARSDALLSDTPVFW